MQFYQDGLGPLVSKQMVFVPLFQEQNFSLGTLGPGKGKGKEEEISMEGVVNLKGTSLLKSWAGHGLGPSLLAQTQSTSQSLHSVEPAEFVCSDLSLFTGQHERSRNFDLFFL